ncbi:hypothetical protein CsatA_025339 [Cannabis sativa]
MVKMETPNLISEFAQNNRLLLRQALSLIPLIIKQRRSSHGDDNSQPKGSLFTLLLFLMLFSVVVSLWL